MRKLAKILSLFYMALDATAIVCAFMCSSYLLPGSAGEGVSWYFVVGLITAWIVVANSFKLYRTNLHNGARMRLSSYIKAYVVYAVVGGCAVYIVPQLRFVDGELLLLSLLTFLSFDFATNAIVINMISAFRRSKVTHVLIAGTGTLALRITRYIESNPDYGFHILGYVKGKHEEPKIGEGSTLGDLSDIGRVLESPDIDEVIIALPYKSSRKKIRKILAHADFQGIRVSYVPDYQGLFGTSFRTFHDGQLDAVNVRQMPLDESFANIPKRIFDVIFSAAALVFLSPILALIAVAIKLDTPGPVFYCPWRAGKARKSFKLYKFRTMDKNDAVVDGKLSTTKNDPRITRVGKYLRKYSLDELPQFFNVLLGDMSVVGPRPHRNMLNQQMKEHVDKYMVRYYFKPGITGWAQVNGWRGPTETEEQISQRTACDLWYIEHWSFLLDLKIIWLTIFGRKTYENAF